MGLKDEISTEVKKIFASQWSTRDGLKVPEAEEVGLGNDAVALDGTILYADLDGSTSMVDKYKKSFSAEVYKTYLYTAAKIIRSEGGTIVSYDGDRVMAVFIGATKDSTAARCALKINWAVKKLVNPLKNAQYPGDDFVIRQVVGIDTCQLWAARTGVRGANDLVWVGSAANYAAKLTTLDSATPTWITKRVYDKLDSTARLSKGVDMWTKKTWTSMNNLEVYCSSYFWSIG